jgi:hypothetical protein
VTALAAMAVRIRLGTVGGVVKMLAIGVGSHFSMLTKKDPTNN